MRRIRKQFWRFSLTISMYKQIKKGYLSYDSHTHHICIHGGLVGRKPNVRIFTMPIYRPQPKAKHKVIHVR